MSSIKNSTIGRSFEKTSLVLDVRDGTRGTPEEWMSVFTDVWQSPAEKLERLLALLDDHVTLKAPTIPPVSVGKEAARKAFQRALTAMPDMSGTIHRWLFADDVLFIEMTFHATIGKSHVSWRNVDRFLFKDGVATERLAHFDPSPVRRAFLGSLAGLAQYWRLRHAK